MRFQKQKYSQTIFKCFNILRLRVKLYESLCFICSFSIFKKLLRIRKK